MRQITIDVLYHHIYLLFSGTAPFVENDKSQDGHEDNYEDVNEINNENDDIDNSDQDEEDGVDNNPPLEDFQDDIFNDDDIRNYDDENDNRPLYNGASITVAESMALILSLILNHQLIVCCWFIVCTTFALYSSRIA